MKSQIMIFLRLYRPKGRPLGALRPQEDANCLEMRAQKLSPRCVRGTMDVAHVSGHISLPFAFQKLRLSRMRWKALLLAFRWNFMCMELPECDTINLQ